MLARAPGDCGWWRKEKKKKEKEKKENKKNKEWRKIEKWISFFFRNCDLHFILTILLLNNKNEMW
jgi:hypothetical protein